MKEEQQNHGLNISTLAFHKMLPSLKHFWQTYCRQMSFSEQETYVNLLKTVNFCALKLIHTCYESTVTSNTLSATSAKMLQLSLNILQSPEEAIGDFLKMDTQKLNR